MSRTMKILAALLTLLWLSLVILVASSRAQQEDSGIRPWQKLELDQGRLIAALETATKQIKVDDIPPFAEAWGISPLVTYSSSKYEPGKEMMPPMVKDPYDFKSEGRFCLLLMDSRDPTNQRFTLVVYHFDPAGDAIGRWLNRKPSASVKVAGPIRYIQIIFITKKLGWYMQYRTSQVPIGVSVDKVDWKQVNKFNPYQGYLSDIKAQWPALAEALEPKR